MSEKVTIAEYQGYSVNDPEQRTIEYFNSEICSFRNMMGDKRYSQDELERAFDALWLLYLNVDIRHIEKAANTIDCLRHEFARRTAYRFTQ